MMRTLCSFIKHEKLLNLKLDYLNNEITNTELRQRLKFMCKNQIQREVKRIESTFFKYKYTSQKEQNLILSFLNECKSDK